MTPLQQDLAQRLRHLTGTAGTPRVVYRTEYLGYLPFGQYHGVTIASADRSRALPDGWAWSDLEALADAGVLARVSVWTNPQDECEQEAQYDVIPPPAEAETNPTK
ncbi:hypothetical protein GobsT_28620 [Gemmata obscuriglobus]|uniref:Uncharacterized protein n=1 Tax=Gemmata obscuriglobus TaxID=114 RepID=A0A2Z3GWU6_9BACT|nr:hypothetical protein [Gemmata obscuriglobus]AWM38909.1 hypothetical protein C1280_19235 [Gemmata obscuriglobus]QEG28089.1 hypothetical protein GobsT_28620 [Gemmata obscuriglobus]VTS05710.1 Uncharacterized protein OS=Pseudomonas sp. SHC52 GN=BN844_1224 PE=4 SV=1 [Gemmata obscuriglobus UQM 2246]